MKFYIKLITGYIFVASIIAWSIFGSPRANADVYLLGDSWLSSQTYNLNSVSQIGFYTGAVVHNNAVNSQPSATLAAQIGNYGIQDGGVAIIDIGLPDFFNGISQTTVRNNMYIVVDWLYSHNVESILSCPADVTSPTALATKIAQNKLKMAWSMCQQIADRHPGFIHVVDLQSKLMAIGEFNVTTGDAVHLNLDGYQIFNTALGDEVRKAKGYCNLLNSAGVQAFFDSHPGMTTQQICTTGNLIQNFWLNQ